VKAVINRTKVVGISVVALSLLCMRAARGQTPATPHNPPLITAVRLEDTAVVGTNRVAAFRIQNRSTATRTFSPMCSVSPELVNCTVREKKIPLKPGETAFVIVRYKAGRTVGTGTLTLRSAEHPTAAGASLKMLLISAPQS
jgi:hypothetical protein